MFIQRVSAAALVLCIVVFCGTCRSEELRAEARVDKQVVGTGERLVLTISVYGADNVADPDLGSLDGFQAVSSQRSQSVSIVNWKTTRSLNLQYVLVAVEEGDYTLGPFKVTTGKETYETEALQVKVVKGQAASTHERAQGASQDDLVVVRASVDKTRAYVGEQITYTLKIAYRAMLDQTEYLPPDHTGFWFEDLGETDKSIEVMDGKQYQVITKQTAYFPISSGSYTLGEATLSYVARTDAFSRDPFGFRDPFSLFRGSQGMARAKPIDIDVLPLPAAGKPADFSGAVGSFSMRVVPSSLEIKAGESLTLSVQIQGRGNLKSISGINVPEFEGFRVFAPKAREEMKVERSLVGGEKVFDLVLVPQRPGDYRLQGFTFSYFDPGKEQYVTTRAEPLNISVLPGEEMAMGELPSGTIPTQAVRRDIRYIKRADISRDELRLSLRGASGAVLRFLPVVVALLGLVVSLQRRRALISGKGVAKKAYRTLLRDLKTARQLAAEGKVAEASALAAKAVRLYFGARKGISESLVDEDMIGAMTNITEDQRARVAEILSSLDRLRFAPVSVERPEAEALIGSAQALLRVVDSQWKD